MTEEYKLTSILSNPKVDYTNHDSLITKAKDKEISSAWAPNQQVDQRKLEENSVFANTIQSAAYRS